MNKQIFVQFLQLQVPLFFLLSGFCLALSYGRKHYTSMTWKLSQKDVPEGSFDATGFLVNRLARLLPMHYVTFAMDSVSVLLGVTSMVKTFILNTSTMLPNYSILFKERDPK